MDIRTMISNAVTWAKFHKGEICAFGAVACGVGATGCAIYESKKARERFAENKKQILTIRDNKDSETYKKDLAMQALKTAGNAAFDMKFTLVCEAGMIIFTILGCSSMRKTITTVSANAAGLASLVALTEEAIRQEYGEEGLHKIKTIRAERQLPVTVKRYDPVSGESHEVKTTEPAPDLEWLDIAARDFLKTQPAEVQAYFDPTSTVLLDDDSILYRSCHGDLDLLTGALRTALDNSNHTLWMNGRIRLRSMVDDLEFISLTGPRFNQDIMDMAGTIDCPTAYDMITKKYVRVKGFDEEGYALERKQYGDFTHKYLSYGEDQDRYLFANPEGSDKPYFIIDDKILLQLSYDGNINNLLIGGVSPERKASAWAEQPEMEK